MFDKRVFWGRAERSPSGCLVWTGTLTSTGYGRVWFYGKDERAHRVAYMLATGEDAAGRVIRHTCDNPPCIEPAHLLAGTLGDNNRDTVARGRHWIPSSVGENNRMAKLTAVDVELIRTCGLPRAEIAALFSITLHHITDIRAGRAWKNS